MRDGYETKFFIFLAGKKVSLLVIHLKRYKRIRETFFMLIKTGIQVPVPQKRQPRYTTKDKH